MEYKTVTIRGIAYYVADLPPNEYGKRKRIYGKTVEELNKKIAEAELYREIRLQIERPREGSSLSEYISCYFRTGNGEQISPTKLRKRQQLFEALIINSDIDLPLKKLTETNISKYLTKLREMYPEETIEMVKDIVCDTLQMPYVLEEHPLDTRKIIIQAPVETFHDCYLTKEQLSTLKEYCLQNYTEKFGVGKDVMAFLCLSGVKVKDLIESKRNAVDLEKKTFTGSNNAVVPLSEECVSWLNRYLTARDTLYGCDEDDYLFCRERFVPVSRTSIGMTISRISQICGMPSGCTANSIHRSFICFLLEDKVNPFEIAEWYGYRKVETIMGYQKDKKIYMALHR